MSAPGRRLGILVAGLLAAGCAPEHAELVKRHEAQRERWHVDREERNWSVSEQREAHQEIARRFGPSDSPTETEMNDPDWWERQAIAGTSALYAVDLASSGEQTPELAAEYDRVAERWSFDEELRLLARFGQGRTLGRLGQLDEAAVALRQVVQVSDETIDADHMTWARPLLLDLEVHLALLERDLAQRDRRPVDLTPARERMLERATRWEGRPEGFRARRRAAELAELNGDVDVAVEEFTELAEQGKTADDRAEIQLALGDLYFFRLDRKAEAERCYRIAVEQGPNVRASAEARVRLMELCVRLGRYQLGLRTADDFLNLGARVQEGRLEEALYWRARCLLELGHWVDAIPTLVDGAAGDPADPFTLACAARLYHRMRTFRHKDTAAAVERLVGVAVRVPAWELVDPPRDWSLTWREQRREFAWKEGADELQVALRSVRDPDQRERGRAALERIRKERLP